MELLHFVRKSVPVEPKEAEKIYWIIISGIEGRLSFTTGMDGGGGGYLNVKLKKSSVVAPDPFIVDSRIRFNELDPAHAIITHGIYL